MKLGVDARDRVRRTTTLPAVLARRAYVVTYVVRDAARAARDYVARQCA
jgi:hypothetical protein